MDESFGRIDDVANLVQRLHSYVCEYLEASLVDPFLDLYRRLAFGLLLVFLLVQIHLPRSISVVVVIIPATVAHKAIQSSLSSNLGGWKTWRVWVGHTALIFQ